MDAPAFVRRDDRAATLKLLVNGTQSRRSGARLPHASARGPDRRGDRAGLEPAGPLKLATRAGMGLCQGRVCQTAIAHLAALAANVSPGELGPPSARFPIHPVQAGAFARLGPEGG